MQYGPLTTIDCYGDRDTVRGFQNGFVAEDPQMTTADYRELGRKAESNLQLNELKTQIRAIDRKVDSIHRKMLRFDDPGAIQGTILSECGVGY